MPPALAGAFPTCAGPSGGGRVCIALRCEARSRRGSFHALAHAVCRCIDYTICMQVLAIAGGPVAFLQKARYRSVLEPGYNYPIARRLRPITKKRTVKMLSRSALRPSPEAAVRLGAKAGDSSESQKLTEVSPFGLFRFPESCRGRGFARRGTRAETSKAGSYINI